MTAAPLLDSPLVVERAPDFTLPSIDGGTATPFCAHRPYFRVDEAGALRWSVLKEHPGRRRTNTERLAEFARLA